jgi:hypothetical protein
MVCVTFANADWVTKGVGFWKLNTTLLGEEFYKNNIESCWQHWINRKASYKSTLQWWEDVKLDLKYVSRKYAIRKAQEIRKRKKTLHRSLMKINAKVNNGEDNYYELLVKIKSKIRDIEQYEFEGAKIRARAQMHAEGEKPTRYFCALEKARAIDKVMCSLNMPDGSTVFTNNEMSTIVCNYYESLYKSEGIDEDAKLDLLANIDKKVSDTGSEFCDQPLTLEDLTKSLKGMKLEKSPGCDGLPVEFYQTFWHLVGPIMEELGTEIFEKGHLPPTMARAYVRLIYKGNDRRLIQNYRPISLLCVDYKIISRALTLKLGSVLGEIIGTEQTCAVPRRTILTNTMVIRDLIQLVEKDSIPSAVIALDNEKAFDRVEWDFLFNSLQSFGLGSNFIKWVKILYTDIKSSYLVNNQLSREIVLERGVRQGCSLSPLLFVIVMESLGIALRQNNNFQGICIRGIERPLKLSQYADDTTVFTSSNNDFAILNHVLEKFQNASGLKINKGKSKGLFLGPWKERNDQPLEINWSNDTIKILGIYFGRKPNTIQNWNERVSKLKRILANWKRRRLSIFGRVFVVNNLALSGLWYTASVVHMPKHVEKEVNELILSFIWEEKNHLVSHRVLNNAKLEGGLDLIDIKVKCVSLRLKFLDDLITSDETWACVSRALMERIVEPFLAEHVFTSKKPPPNSQMIPDVFKDQVKELEIFDRYMPPPTCWKEVLEQQLWGNSNICYNNAVLYLPSFAKYGIQHLSDMIHPQTRRWISMQEVARKTHMRHIDVQRLLNKIKHAVPIEWFRLPNVNNNSLTPQPALVLDDEMLKYKMRSKEWYHIMRRKQVTPPIAIRRWDDSSYKPSSWKNVWKILHSPYIPNMARDLLWRLLHRRLWVGHLTYKCNITTSDRCYLCQTDEETIEHLFAECPISSQFWDYISQILAKFGAKPIVLDTHVVLFREFGSSGVNIIKSERTILITILTIGVWAIWKHRCAQTKNPSMGNHNRAIKAIFRSLLLNHIPCEYFRLKQHGKEKVFKDIWCKQT